MSFFHRRAVTPLVLGSFLVWGALPACNLVIGGEDKILIGLGETNGGAGGDGGAGNGASPKGGESGTEAGGSGPSGAGGGGAAGVAGKGGAAGANAGTGGGGTSAGTGGAGSGGAAGSTSFSKPGGIDCDAPPTQGTHRFCTDFAPLPVGWAGAGCSLASAADGNVYWRWEQNVGSTCQSFVTIELGSPHTSATMSMWLRVDALGLGDDKIAVMYIALGKNSETKGEVAVRVERDGNGAVTGTTLVVQTVEPTPQVKVIGALALGDWRHVRLRVAADGTVRGSFGSTNLDTISSMDVATKAGLAAAPYIELPFRQLSPGTAPTRISVDELTVDVTN